jgi:hypothetical protein
VYKYPLCSRLDRACRRLPRAHGRQAARGLLRRAPVFVNPECQSSSKQRVGPIGRKPARQGRSTTCTARFVEMSSTSAQAHRRRHLASFFQSPLAFHTCNARRTRSKACKLRAATAVMRVMANNTQICVDLLNPDVARKWKRRSCAQPVDLQANICSVSPFVAQIRSTAEGADVPDIPTPSGTALAE